MMEYPVHNTGPGLGYHMLVCTGQTVWDAQLEGRSTSGLSILGSAWVRAADFLLYPATELRILQ